MFLFSSDVSYFQNPSMNNWLEKVKETALAMRLKAMFIYCVYSDFHGNFIVGWGGLDVEWSLTISFINLF